MEDFNWVPLLRPIC